jgi:cytochrome c-type biogenesis protein CcmH/NrfF
VRPAGLRPLVLLALTLTLALTPAAVASAQAPEPRTTLPDVEDEVMCPVCGTTLETAEAPQAERERELIRRLIAEGLTKDEIKDRLVAEYGEEVLATPQGGGFDAAAWLVPGLGIAVVGALLATFALRRRRRSGDGDTLAGPEPAETSRLNEDMSRYDL